MDVSYHYLRRTARAKAKRLNRRYGVHIYAARKTGRRLFRWKVVDTAATPK